MLGRFRIGLAAKPRSVSQSNTYRSAVVIANAVFRPRLAGGCLSERLCRVRQIVSALFFVVTGLDGVAGSPELGEAIAFIDF